MRPRNEQCAQGKGRSLLCMAMSARCREREGGEVIGVVGIGGENRGIRKRDDWTPILQHFFG